DARSGEMFALCADQGPEWGNETPGAKQEVRELLLAPLRFAKGNEHAALGERGRFRPGALGNPLSSTSRWCDVCQSCYGGHAGTLPLFASRKRNRIQELRRQGSVPPGTLPPWHALATIRDSATASPFCPAGDRTARLAA